MSSRGKGGGWNSWAGKYSVLDWPVSDGGGGGELAAMIRPKCSLRKGVAASARPPTPYPGMALSSLILCVPCEIRPQVHPVQLPILEHCMEFKGNPELSLGQCKGLAPTQECRLFRSQGGQRKDVLCSPYPTFQTCADNRAPPKGGWRGWEGQNEGRLGHGEGWGGRVGGQTIPGRWARLAWAGSIPTSLAWLALPRSFTSALAIASAYIQVALLKLLLTIGPLRTASAGRGTS